MAEDRAHDPARRFVPGSLGDGGYAIREPSRWVPAKDFKKHNEIEWVTPKLDSAAQQEFKERGFNKGKAGDMAKNIGANVETSLKAAKDKYSA
jgi:hypothetical protein